jgi:Delta3-Delta2-enoyl-CoA isomerase
MEWITLDREAGIGLLTLNRPPENRFTGPFTAEVRGAFAQAAQDPEINALIVTSALEKYFSNGLDLGWMMSNPPETVTAFLLDMTQLLKDTALFPKPLIGAINGHAFGLGAIWSSGFDFRIMRADRGWVCFPEMDINIPFLPGMIALCEHGLGVPLFREMAWTAKRYPGPEAVAAGWARAAVSADELLPKARELAVFMAAKKQPAFGLTKQRWAARIARVIDELDPDAIRTMAPAGAPASK